MKSLNIKQSITKRDSRALKSYFQEIKNIPILDHDQEYELAYASFKGDEKAREKLIKHNLRFVISVAKQYENPHLRLEDLINEGNMGLVVASTKFDPSRGFKFLSYAIHWIRNYILSYIADNGKTIRLPNNKINLLTKIKDRYSKLEQTLNRPPSYNELAETLEDEYGDEDLIFYYNTITNPITSLDTEVGHDGNTTALYNLIKDTNNIDAEYYVDKSDTKYRQHTILNLLDKEIEKEVITLLYGLDGQTPLQLKTIGFLLGLTSERVRQIRNISLRKLKIGLSK